MPEACLGGEETGNDLCVVGHIGALCESCDLYQVKWAVNLF